MTPWTLWRWPPRCPHCPWSGLCNDRGSSHNWLDIVVFIGLGIGKVSVGVDLGSNCRLSNSNILGNIMNREVGSSNSEAQSISNIVDTLSQSIGVNIAVGSSDHSISSLNFLLCLINTVETKVVLTGIILGVELSTWGWFGCSKVLSVVTSVGSRGGVSDGGRSCQAERK